MSSATQTWILVAIAGAAGTLLRYVMGGVLVRATGGVFPWETFVINALGCFAVGAVAGVLDKGALLPPPLRMAIMVGFIGGFTTFSTFALETFRLATAGEWAGAGSYVILTNFVGFVAVWAGYQMAMV